MSLTAEKQSVIQVEFQKRFPSATFRNFTDSITAHVKSFNTSQVMFLNELINDQNAEMMLKRSGTGISIKFF